MSIAKFITEWRPLGERLQLTDAQMEEVEAAQGGGEYYKKLKMLKRWRESQYRNATYRRLISALVFLGKQEKAADVCRLLGLQPSDSGRGVGTYLKVGGLK